MSKCLLCNCEKQDPRCGEFIEKGKIVVHEFCLYLSSALLTNGDDDNGLYGFLPKDIYAESKRTSQLDCAYCHQPYANIGCCKAKCQRSFHTLCGIENGCENQFVGTFRSYCDKHIHKHLRKIPKPNEICCICYDSIQVSKAKNHRNHLWVNYIEAPCCKNGWFHRQCLQGFARSAGYFFKCPLCNDTKKFKEEMPYRGIFVPDRDAAWELEPNAFAELLERPSKCEAEFCKHKLGRNSCDDPDNPLEYCKICGAVAAHQNCLPQKLSDFICKDCANVTERVRSSEDSGRESLPITNQFENENENEEIDVCAVSESDDDSDFLETVSTKRTRRIVISDSSDMENLKVSNCKSCPDKDKNKRARRSSDENRFHYDSSEDCGGSADFEYKETRSAANNCKIYDSGESSDCIKFRRQKNSCYVIDSTDESSDESIKMKSKKNLRLIIDSTEEDNDSSSSFQERLSSKRRRLLQNEKISHENANKKYIENLQNGRKPLNDLNSMSPHYSKNTTSNESYQAFSTNLNAVDVESKADISCIANRTRRRKRIYYKEPLKEILDSEYEKSDNSSTPAVIGKRRFLSSSSSSSMCSSLGYSSTISSTVSSCSGSTNSSTPSVLPSTTSTRQLRRQTRPKSQKSPSFNSLSSDISSIATNSAVEVDSDNNAMNISCIANRTRRKSVPYLSKLDFINEESDDDA